MKRKTLSILLTLVMVLTLALVTAAPVSADVINVPGDYTTIQAAVDGASDGDVIRVNAGTYSECVIIDGVDVTLMAAGSVTIEPPLGGCGGHGDTIQIYNSTTTVDGFTIIGDVSGIYLRGMGDYGDTEVEATIRNNTVVGYWKNGITANGELATAHIHGNRVDGSGPVGPGSAAQNGIQFGYGATGEAIGNAVNGNWYTGADWSASGILVFESDNVTVQGNTVTGSQTGIAVETWHYFGVASASGNKIIRNTVEDADWAISVTAYTLGGYSTGDAWADNNKVVNNVIVADGGDTGVYVGALFAWGGEDTGFTPSADNNKVIRNRISGYETPIDEGGTASKVHANVMD